ncbi:failed axon connections homolog [Homarus americanus]|uniref:failed axon connections homolog n=1 Tax=Homarus americanus TaxID=6706 RepID=UPI001C48E1A0|nr:failed axon connections homolog [Homarus americanus]XP_042214891.1 failed axon connections homolog [Homarus americanus]XP_042214892.1 failed axon connections homolog [Homarus americanus]XP_042214893.1 failed axon connections homolog [Homarus americanus]
MGVTEVLEVIWPGDWMGRGRTLLTTLGVIVLTTKIVKERKRRRLRREWDSAGKDVVLLHQFKSGKYCPNLSPFALKLETFFRLANIKYVVDTKSPYGSKGKCPWITVNGTDVADSEFIVEYITEHFNVNIDAHLDPRKVAILEAVRVLADEHLFWCVVVWRYWLDGCVTFLKSQSFSPFLRFIFPIFLKPGMRDRSRHHGIGLHSPEEIYHICKKDCRTLAGVLGDDKFFGGDEPCTADCTAFGQLAQLMWNAPGSRYQALVTEVYPSLARYCLNMKERLYPDWNKLLKPPQQDLPSPPQ